MIKDLISNKSLLVFLCLVVCLVVVLNKDSIGGLFKKEKTVIVACPTYHKIIEKIDSDNYEFVFSSSTAESLNLLQNGQADMALSGRVLKPNEPFFSSLVAGEGYSFLADKPALVYSYELNNYKFYTDLKIESVKDNLQIKNVEKVDNVYDYLEKGIVITSWENTDYSRAEIVHLFKDNGKRLELSRRPVIYCSSSCNDKAQEVRKILIQ